MSHFPTSADIATDLRRCVYASLSPKKFSDETYLEFYHHAQKIYLALRKSINPTLRKEVNKRLKKTQNSQNPDSERREDLLTASILLLQ